MQRNETKCGACRQNKTPSFFRLVINTKKIEVFGSVWPECCVHTQSGWEVSQELVQIDALMSITESKH